MSVKEKWKPVKGLEDLYEISNTGLVRSLTRDYINKNGKRVVSIGRILSGNKDRDGYIVYHLYRKTKRYPKKAHRLVAEAFLGDITNMTIDHLDMNKRNNCVNNLEIVPYKENMLRARKKGAFRKHRKLTFRQAELIREMYHSKYNQNCELGTKPFTYRWLAKCFKLNDSAIANIVKGRYYKYE